jgi:hypothetical protein
MSPDIFFKINVQDYFFFVQEHNEAHNKSNHSLPFGHKEENLASLVGSLN